MCSVQVRNFFFTHYYLLDYKMVFYPVLAGGRCISTEEPSDFCGSRADIQ